jgi:Flp pilus assembly pilin Flp
VSRSRGEHGAAAVAYAVMIAVIAMLLVAGVWALSDQIGAALTGGAECLENPGDCAPAGGGGGDGGGGGGSTTSTSTSTTTTRPPPGSVTAVP